MKPQNMHAGVISFGATLVVIATATQLTANSGESEIQAAALEVVKGSFKPAVYDKKAPPRFIDIEDDVQVTLTPVEAKGVFALDLTFTRSPDAQGIATPSVDLDCAAVTYSNKRRVTRPIQVKLGTQKFAPTLEPGQVVTQRVTFEPTTKQRRGGLSGAKIHFASGGHTIKNATRLKGAVGRSRARPTRPKKSRPKFVNFAF